MNKINDRTDFLIKKMNILLDSPTKTFNEVKNIGSNGIYIIYMNDKPIYVGSTTTKGHRRMSDLVSFWDNHTLHKKLLKEKLGISRLIWCKKGGTSKYSKEQLIQTGNFTEEQFNKANEETLILIKTFNFKFYEMPLEKPREIKNFEHFVIAILNPPYND